ncbi:type II toxin-antitoxin system RelE/ParE family toxin [Nitrosomonas sp.]|uniref:type II toxin-antitoxin system RelE/ParE family toxin n=1 Tax=Nitrosomonas sp. TaxID=42353 RepID=UPI0025CE3B03|nr:type II toxin-antitoxin system RelE/ParE family toxin [Nitrosomonas sp.]MBY0483337.1 type II toxin-antitoxin system RelE/ParE family toxin [Nitrosomonas sp.]
MVIWAQQAVDELNGLPKMGRVVPELNEEDVRELFLYSYRIIYEIKDEVIFVLAVVHQRRNLKDENIPRES